MKNKIGITAAAALLMFASTLVANAQNGRANSNMSYGNRFLRIADLTEEQKEKITSISEAHKTTIDEMREQVRNSEDIYSSNEIRAKMILEQNTHFKSISAVLNDEQLKEFNEHINSRNIRSGRDVGHSRQGSRGRHRSATMQHDRRGMRRGYGRG